MVTENFPDLKETKIRLKELRKIQLLFLDENNNPIDLCKKWLDKYHEIFPELPIRKKTFECKDFDMPLYRASIIRERFNENLLFEYSYPPKSMTPIGRCNFPGYPVLYTSFDPKIAL